MAKIIKCNNNHFYDADEFERCPYCFPEEMKLNENSGTVKTEMNNAFNPSPVSDTNKTTIPSNQSPVSDANKTTAPSNHQQNINEQIELDKTFIPGVVSNQENIDSHQKFIQRKIVGWIISFEMNPYGIDFRIYEGKNTIGRKPGNDITINEPSVSSNEHAIILTRADRIFISDKSSTNGTSINGQILFPDESKELKDGDEILFGKGKAKFLFRAAKK